MTLFPFVLFEENNNIIILSFKSHPQGCEDKEGRSVMSGLPTDKADDGHTVQKEK